MKYNATIRINDLEYVDVYPNNYFSVIFYRDLIIRILRIKRDFVRETLDTQTSSITSKGIRLRPQKQFVAAFHNKKM